MNKTLYKLFLLLPLIVLGGIGSGCGGDETPQLMGCDGDSDCPSGYICGVTQTCVELLIFDNEGCLEGEEDCLPE